MRFELHYRWNWSQCFNTVYLLNYGIQYALKCRHVMRSGYVLFLWSAGCYRSSWSISAILCFFPVRKACIEWAVKACRLGPLGCQLAGFTVGVRPFCLLPFTSPSSLPVPIWWDHPLLCPFIFPLPSHIYFHQFFLSPLPLSYSLSDFLLLQMCFLRSL